MAHDMPKPRIRYLGGGKWRCRVELSALIAIKGVGQLTMFDYAAPGAEGWGDRPERAYAAWDGRWRALFEKKQ